MVSVAETGSVGCRSRALRLRCRGIEGRGWTGGAWSERRAADRGNPMKPSHSSGAAKRLNLQVNPGRVRARGSLRGPVTGFFGLFLGWILSTASLVATDGQNPGVPVAPPPVPSKSPADAVAEGQGREWARRLRSSAPEQASTNQAVLRIRSREGRKKVPVTVITRPGEDRWSVEYRVGSEERSETTQVATIHYRMQGPPTFEVQPKGSRTPGESVQTAGDLSIGGSDFLLKELGMEFLHWPEQRILSRELSNGRWCQVLESRSGKPAGAVAVRSWIDEKLGVVLSAEVYDARQVRIKHFSITQFREQADRWSCSVSMVDDQRGTKTELSFDGPAPR